MFMTVLVMMMRKIDPDAQASQSVLPHSLGLNGKMVLDQCFQVSLDFAEIGAQIQKAGQNHVPARPAHAVKIDCFHRIISKEASSQESKFRIKSNPITLIDDGLFLF